MANPVLAGRFELLSLMGDDSEVRTSRAREIATGRPCLVHELKSAPPVGVLQPLLQRVLRFEECDQQTRDRAGIIEIFQHEGVRYVITMIPRNFTHLRQMLDLNPKPSSSSQDFTRAGMWSVPPVGVQPPSPPPPSTPLASQPPTAPAPAAQQPGEFTRMFQAQAGPPPGAPVPSAPPVPPPSAPATPAPAVQEPGEFTRFFQSPLASRPLEPPPAAASVATPVPTTAPAPSPGEYTRLFQSPPSPPTQAASTGATGAFFASALPGAAPIEPVPQGPSEFTMVVQRGSAAGFPPAAPPAAAGVAQPPASPAPSPAPRSANLPGWLVAVLSALFVAALMLILILVLKR